MKKKLAMLATTVILNLAFFSIADARGKFSQMLFGEGEKTLYYRGLEKTVYSPNFDKESLPDEIRLSLYHFTGLGLLEFYKNGSVTCIGYLQFMKGANGPSIYAQYRFLSKDDMSDCLNAEIINISPIDDSIDKIEFYLLDKENPEFIYFDYILQLDKEESAKLEEYARSPCGYANWRGYINNLADLVFCDELRAISELEEGRLIEIKDADISFRDGNRYATVVLKTSPINILAWKISNSTAQFNDKWSAMNEIQQAPALRITCAFDAETGKSLKQGANGIFSAKLIEYSSSGMTLDCKQPSQAEIVDAYR